MNLRKCLFCGRFKRLVVVEVWTVPEHHLLFRVRQCRKCLRAIIEAGNLRWFK